MTLSLAIVAVSILVSALTALAVWLNNTRLREDGIYIVTSLSYVLLGLFNYLSTVTSGSGKVWLARCVMAAAATSIMLTYVLIQRLLFPESRERRRYTRTRYPLHLLIILLAFSPLVIKGFDVLSGPKEKLLFGHGMPIYGLYLLIYVVFSTSKLIMSIFRGTDKHKQAQGRLMLIGFLPVLLLAPITSMYLPAVYGNLRFISLTPVYSAFFVIMVGYAMIRHKLFGIRSFVLTATAYTVTTVFLAFIYVLPTVYAISRIWNVETTWFRTTLVLIIVLVIATNYGRVQRVFNSVTNRYFFRDSYDPTELIRQINKVCASTIDINKLLRDTTRIVQEGLKAEYCLVLLPETEVRPYSIIGTMPKNHSLEAEKLWSSVHHLESDIVIETALPNRETKVKQSLVQQDIALFVRLFVEQNEVKDVLGYLVIGPRKSGKAYNRQDVAVIEAITSTLIIAMQNALHFEEIQNFNATLQQRVEEATRQLKRTNAKLEALDETKDEFISMASHQLRTPLTSVKGYLSMVLEGDTGELNAGQRQMLSQSFASAQRMVYLISDLLNLSRLNTGKFVIEAGPVDLRDIVAAEIEQLRETAKAREINLSYDPPKEFPTLMLDETKTHQVVMNFMDNAIYYTPPGGSVSIILRETATAVEFRVKDSGIGVARDVQRHLFSKFYRAENARRVRPDGTGLGLFMAKKIVIAEGGAIIFESEEGKGSTFGFRFQKASHAVADSSKKPE